MKFKKTKKEVIDLRNKCDLIRSSFNLCKIHENDMSFINDLYSILDKITEVYIAECTEISHRKSFKKAVEDYAFAMKDRMRVGDCKVTVIIED